ncbi:MAG: ferredoxin family protein [Selenomonas sp.]
MSIRIETSTCIGCGRCTDVCPGNLLFLKDKRAAIRDVRDCWGCTACVKECPKNAIFFTLEAELGGAGGRLYAQDCADTLAWVLKLADGEEQRIVVNKKQANAY